MGPLTADAQAGIMIVLCICRVFLNTQGLSFFLSKMRLVPVDCMDECYELGQGGGVIFLG